MRKSYVVVNFWFQLILGDFTINFLTNVFYLGDFSTFVLEGGLGGGRAVCFSKRITCSPSALNLSLSLYLTPLAPLTLSLDLTPQFFFLFGTHLDLYSRPDFEVHLHLHYTTQAFFANLLIFVGLISYWSQTHPSPLTQINLVRKKLTN